MDAVAPREIQQTIADLIELKRVTPELGAGDAIPELNDFVYLELQKHEGVLTGQGRPDLHEKQSVLDELNDVYRQSISEAFGGET